MMAASYGLQNTSNNVANMESPGFKRTDVFYSSLGDNSGQYNPGLGVTIGGHGTNFKAGTMQSTGNPSDLAIDGNGFFIVKLKNGELLYTRDGEFGFDNDGILIDKHSGGQVQGYDAKGALVPISKYGPRTCPGKPTTSMNLSGEFIIVELDDFGKNPDSNFAKIQFDATVYDTKGKAHTISFEFQSPKSPVETPDVNDNQRWKLISATCKDAQVDIDTEQTIIFQTDSNGSAKYDHNKVKFKLNNDQTIIMNFGNDQNSSDFDDSVRLFKKDGIHVNSTIEVKKNDGYAEGKQLSFSFDENGLISYSYNNGQSEKGIHVALASFDDMEHTLMQAHDNLFRSKTNHGRHIGRANQQSFGAIKPQKLESSNVDSTMEFANIVVLQRMFQACSQIMDIDKQLLEELYKK